MVKSVRRCFECRQKFISFAGQQCCLSCKENSAVETATSEIEGQQSSKRAAASADDTRCKNAKRTRLNPSSSRGSSSSSSIGRANDSPTRQNHDFEYSDGSITLNSRLDGGNGLIGLNNEEDSHSEGSERGDDLNCTQIVQTDEEEDEEINENDIQEEDVAKELRVDNDEYHEPKLSKSTDFVTEDVTKDICFICGTSLTNLKRRIDHIKRCSKKHGISARDVKVNDDHEEFAVNDDASTRKTQYSNNPYSKNNSQWHGDAMFELRLAAQAGPQNEGDGIRDEVPTLQGTSSISKNQTTMKSFFQAPMRNLNTVLVSAARRMSKWEQINSARKDMAKSATKRFFGGKFSKKNCPMYKIIPGTDFIVDGFQYANSSLSRSYFLTHFHSDHYGGITANWNAGTIYCSMPTANLLAQQLRVDKKYIHPLPMFEPIVLESKGKPTTVTLLDANHCPGAVMFLFNVGNHRQILHVGDFRWDQKVMLKQGPLALFASGKLQLDELFLDTTYCNPKYTLPSQEEAINATVTLVKRELQQSKEKKCKTLHLFGSYTIGKERIYLAVAEQLGLKVYVDGRRYNILSALEWPKERMNLLTTNKAETNVWVIPLGDINMKKLPDYWITKVNGKNIQCDRIVGYRPTGWSMPNSGSIVSSRSCGNIIIHGIPYSEHSSFPELLDCLQHMKPKKIVPTVNVSKSNNQIEMLLNALRQKQTRLPFRAKDRK